jgi:hypothetical protein
LNGEQHIPLPTERKPEQRCSIDLTNESIWIHWTPPLPDVPHPVSPVEIMAAGALFGIARTLTGKGATEVAQALRNLDKAPRRKAKGRQ